MYNKTIGARLYNDFFTNTECYYCKASQKGSGKPILVSIHGRRGKFIILELKY